MMMNEVLHANIFFLIASIATVVFCVLVSLVLYQVLKITKSIRSIVERIEAGSEMIAEDITRVRELIVSGGVISHVIKFFMGRFGSRGSKRRSRTKE